MNAKPVDYHQGAVGDVKNAVNWYYAHSPKAALDFVDELQLATEAVRQAPHRWPEGKHETRRFLLWRFPFTLIYSERETVITIWAVAHASRRPEYWAKRVHSGS